MNTSVKGAAILCLLTVLEGCVIRVTPDAGRGAPVSLDRPTVGNGMIVGFIDDTNSEGKISYVTIWDTQPRARTGSKGLPIRMLEDGTFVAENVPPGQYFVPRLASKKWVASITNRDVLQPFEVRAGQVRYWGAYAVDFKDGSDMLGMPARVTVSTSTRMNKRQVLQKVLSVARGSGWEAALNKELGNR